MAGSGATISGRNPSRNFIVRKLSGCIEAQIVKSVQEIMTKKGFKPQ